MQKKTLLLRARGESLCSDYGALKAGVRRFVGRKLVEVEPGQFGFAPTNESEKHSYRHEYVREVQMGCLWAADAATAELCSVKFDPTFGGELPEPAKAQPSPAPAAEKKGQ